LSTWQTECVQQLQMLSMSNYSLSHLKDFFVRPAFKTPQLHLAIFVEPYLTFILDGRKTVESRFSCVRCAPFDKVRANDIIVLKRAGGAVAGICRAEAAWFYKINRQVLTEIQKNFATQICPAESGFWSERAGSSYATLISLTDVVRVPEFRIRKRDRRGWVTIPSWD
jgi:hypothetical protein